MNQFILNLFLILTVLFCANALNLEQREAELENQLGGLESLVKKILEQELVERYGMIRRCPMPHVDHGKVECNQEDRIPGTHCKDQCAPGYVATESVTCQKGGQTWSGQLRYE